MNSKLCSISALFLVGPDNRPRETCPIGLADVDIIKHFGQQCNSFFASTINCFYFPNHQMAKSKADLNKLISFFSEGPLVPKIIAYVRYLCVLSLFLLFASEPQGSLIGILIFASRNSKKVIFCKSVKPGENRPLLWSTCETKLGHLFYSSRLDSDESEICNKFIESSWKRSL